MGCCQPRCVHSDTPRVRCQGIRLFGGPEAGRKSSFASSRLYLWLTSVHRAMPTPIASPVSSSRRTYQLCSCVVTCSKLTEMQCLRRRREINSMSVRRGGCCTCLVYGEAVRSRHAIQDERMQVLALLEVFIEDRSIVSFSRGAILREFSRLVLPLPANSSLT